MKDQDKTKEQLTDKLAELCQQVTGLEASEAEFQAIFQEAAIGTVEDITEHKRAEEALRQRNRELALLNWAGQAFNSTLDPDQVLITVLEEVRHLMDVVACSIWLIDPKTDEIVCRQATGPQSDIVRGWRLAPGEGLVGSVARHGESLIVPDTQADERYFRGVDQETGLALRSILSVPLLIKEDVIGVLQAVDTEVSRFDTGDLALLEPLAASAAIAIENARLYEQAQQEIAERKQAEEASRESEVMDAREYTFIKRKVMRLTGVDLNCYKTPQVQRRLKTYLVRSGQPNWHKFFQAVQNDPVAVSKLKDYLTINVSSFFRDAEKFDYLRDAILPDLTRGRPRLHVWSAGCSHGHEPYSLAILLAEATGFYRRHHILASDIDRSALERTQAGGPYSAEEVEKLDPALLNRYFRSTDDGYYAIDDLQRRITARYQNLLTDPFESGFDLIVCRNVVIYFTAEVKNRLYRQFYDALRPGGVLFVGGTEVVPRASELGFESAGISFYRRKE